MGPPLKLPGMRGAGHIELIESESRMGSEIEIVDFKIDKSKNSNNKSNFA